MTRYILSRFFYIFSLFLSLFASLCFMIYISIFESPNLPSRVPEACPRCIRCSRRKSMTFGIYCSCSMLKSRISEGWHSVRYILLLHDLWIRAPLNNSIRERTAFSVWNAATANDTHQKCDAKSRMMGGSTEKHGEMLPSTTRAIICGSSNCGKINILKLAQKFKRHTFRECIRLLKIAATAKDRYLENLFTSIHEIGYFTFFNNSDVVPPSETRPNSIFIFDDVACDKQNAVREYFSMGHHANVDCFYFCQAYARISKHLIRDNTNLLILFRQDWYQLETRLQRSCEYNDMSYDEFCLLSRLLAKKNMCNGFIVIDKDSALKNGRYRKGFNEFAILWLVIVDTSPETNIADMREREKIAREMKTSKSICKKHHALKTGRIEDIGIEQTF